MNKITVTQLKKLRLEQVEALINSNQETMITKYNKPLAYLVPIGLYRLSQLVVANSNKGME